MSAPHSWQEEVDRLLALWALASASAGFFALQFERDAYRALQHYMAMRP